MIVHEKRKNRTSFSTTETVVELLGLANGKGRCFFFVEGASTYKVPPDSLQRDDLRH
jgi:hypothetical protein